MTQVDPTHSHPSLMPALDPISSPSHTGSLLKRLQSEEQSTSQLSGIIKRYKSEHKKLLAKIANPKWEIAHHYHMTCIEHQLGSVERCTGVQLTRCCGGAVSSTGVGARAGVCARRGCARRFLTACVFVISVLPPSSPPLLPPQPSPATRSRCGRASSGSSSHLLSCPRVVSVQARSDVLQREEQGRPQQRL